MFLFKMGQRVMERDIAVFIADHQRFKLAKTCFRANQTPKAGSFAHWATIEDLFHDRDVKSLFSEQVAQIFRAQKEYLDNGKNSHYVTFTIDLGHTIGWGAAAPLMEFEASELESRSLNGRHMALWVKPTSRRLAPPTNKLSFLCQFRFEHTDRFGSEWKAIIFRVATGAAICDMEGNVNGHARLAFFPWNHPGEPIRR